MTVYASLLSRATRSLLAASAVMMIGSLLTTSTAQAQANGYDFGIGWGYAQPAIRFTTPREDLPYFAKFPPVYYGDMVRRPYGYSPYALPPGIEPVEQRVIEKSMGPRTVMNPFFERRAVRPQQALPAPAAPTIEQPTEVAPSAIEPSATDSPGQPAIEDGDIAA